MIPFDKVSISHAKILISFIHKLLKYGIFMVLASVPKSYAKS